VDSFSSRSPSDWFDRVERAREEPGDACEVSGDELPHPGTHSAPVHMSLRFDSHEAGSVKGSTVGFSGLLGVGFLFPLFENEGVQAGHARLEGD
jgi:hypothetical protein